MMGCGLLFFALVAFSSEVWAQSSDLPKGVCYQLEGLKPSCVSSPGPFCIGECTPEIRAGISRCDSVSVCGENCQGTADPEPISCPGQCWTAVRTTYTYMRSECTGSRTCISRDPDRQVCDESGCRVIKGSCRQWSECARQCVQKNGSCITGYTGTPNGPTASGCSCRCNGTDTPPTVPTCNQQSDNC